MSDIAVFGYVGIIAAGFVALWVAYHMISECWNAWVYDYRRARAFAKWRQQERGLRGME